MALITVFFLVQPIGSSDDVCLLLTKEGLLPLFLDMGKANAYALLREKLYGVSNVHYIRDLLVPNCTCNFISVTEFLRFTENKGTAIDPLFRVVLPTSADKFLVPGKRKIRVRK